MRFRWHGEGRTDMPPGAIARAAVDLLVDGEGPVTLCHHLQRHHSIETIGGACYEAGLEIVELRGESPADGLVPHPDEEEHLKIACLARKNAQQN
jgi:hypothetical protein